MMKKFDILDFYDKAKVEGRKYEPAEVKTLMRTHINNERKKLDNSLRKQYSEQISEITLMVGEVAQAKMVALYASTPFEPSTNALLEILKRRKIDVILPVLGTSFKRDWTYFSSLDDLQVLIEGRPPEPSTGALGEDAIKKADIILAPALACDIKGNRLGYGGGWYDRVLNRKSDDVKVFTIVYDEELYTESDGEIPTEPHDIPVDGVITPTRCLRL